MNLFSDDGSDDDVQGKDEYDHDDGEDEENSIELKLWGIKVEMNLNKLQETWLFEV